MSSLSTRSEPRIKSDEALKSARLDAEKAYRDLSGYSARVRLAEDGWHVDYELIDPQKNGGGPLYIISSDTGQILFKRYEQ